MQETVARGTVVIGPLSYLVKWHGIDLCLSNLSSDVYFVEYEVRKITSREEKVPKKIETSPDHARVRFQGEDYWLHDHHLLSPLDHYDEEGNLLADPFRDISYAVVRNGDVLRFGERIGGEEEILHDQYIQR